jgi:thiopeptide-type bacteriocin biosynthesis protein
MSAPLPFAVAAGALLRVATLPATRAADTWLDLDPADPEQSGPAAGYLRRLLADPVLREAVEVSSRSLAGTLDRVAAGAPPQPRALARAVFATTRYLLRAATRPTPFGLFAGVAMAGFAGDGPGGDPAGKVRLGTAHRRWARPDLGWLAALVDRWERDPAGLAGLRVVANDLCVLRGDRLVLPYGASATEAQLAEVSVRYRPPVRLAMTLAATPVRFADLVDRVHGAYPGTSRGAVTGMLRSLVERELLLTDLRPPPTTADPLGHVRDRLTDPDAAAALDALAGLLRDYAGTPLGAGLAAWRAVTAATSRLHAADRPVQVDLGIDADVRLPRIVAAEAERAAAALARLGPAEPGSAHLRRYHGEFLERYGTDRLVPVLELLDPERGLGAPAGYQLPPGPHRPQPPEEADADRARDRLFGELATAALLAGDREVLLTEPLLAELARGGDAEPLPSVELHAHLLAGSVPDIAAGRFRLAVTAMVGSTQAGATLGRFAYPMPEVAQALAGLAPHAVDDPAVLPAQLEYPAFPPRAGNVAQVPGLLPHRLPVGVFADRADPQVLALADLAVCADQHRLYLVSRRLGRQVAPVSFHMLNEQRIAPNPVRLVREIAASGRRPWRGWDWQAAEALPYLPRVRHGRTILAAARWRPDPTLAEAGLPFAAWRDRFTRWRDRLQVPDIVHATVADNRVELNLTAGLHLRLLHQELRRRPHTVLYEPPAGGEFGLGWLDGHASELVFPLVRREPARSARSGRPTARTAPGPAPVEHLPGGEWLYAKLYAGPQRHAELLTEHLPRLLAALPDGVDRWFFVRYADPEPHLRLRFHGEPAVLAGTLLPALNGWAGPLRERGLARLLVLDTYRPEPERYGGPGALAAAEQVFCADSRAVLDQLRLRAAGRLALPDPLLAAVNHVAVLRGLDRPGWPQWLVATFPHGSHPTIFREHRAAALELIDPGGDWAALRAVPGGAELVAGWQPRAEALGRYGRLLDAGWTGPAAALLHMHHNRLAGIDAAAEARSYAVASGAVRALRDRARHRR